MAVSRHWRGVALPRVRHPMNLYLSSYRLGEKSEVLRSMVKGARRVAVIRNALDFSSDAERLESGRQRELNDLRSLGLDPIELDLRSYFSRCSELHKQLLLFDAVWVVGGNSFILRRAMRESGLDSLLKNDELGREFVYAGYSAGACAVSLTLRGIDNVDSPNLVPDGYPLEPVWEGVGLVPFAIAPHYQSAHPDSGAIESSIQYFIDHDIPFIKLRDREAYVGNAGARV